MTPSDSSSDLSDPAVAPPPRSDQLLDRVRALLAKAERTEFPDEADALMAIFVAPTDIGNSCFRLVTATKRGLCDLTML